MHRIVRVSLILTNLLVLLGTGMIKVLFGPVMFMDDFQDRVSCGLVLMTYASGPVCATTLITSFYSNALLLFKKKHQRKWQFQVAIVNAMNKCTF